MNNISLAELTEQKNSKRLLTPGPASLCLENLTGLGPFFGRGDQDYEILENEVMDRLKKMSGHENIARLQGSGTLGLEIAIRNFVSGRVLCINSGFYAERNILFCQTQKNSGIITRLDVISPDEINAAEGEYDWIVSCYVETSNATLLDVFAIQKLAQRTGAKIYFDAVASIGLEENHHVADVIAYSSCKGLFGLTGACFIAYNDEPSVNEPSFYLNINTHLKKLTTGPYHPLASLLHVLRDHDSHRESVVRNKQVFKEKFSEYLTHPAEHEPLLCTHISKEIRAVQGDYVFYTPRSSLEGAVVCHIGEVHLKKDAEGKILDDLELV